MDFSNLLLYDYSTALEKKKDLNNGEYITGLVFNLPNTTKDIQIGYVFSQGENILDNPYRKTSGWDGWEINICLRVKATSTRLGKIFPDFIEMGFMALTNDFFMYRAYPGGFDVLQEFINDRSNYIYSKSIKKDFNNVSAKDLAIALAERLEILIKLGILRNYPSINELIELMGCVINYAPTFGDEKDIFGYPLPIQK